MQPRGEDSLIEEHERLERLFRQKKEGKVNPTQIQYKVTELYAQVQTLAVDLPELRQKLLKRAPELVCRLCTEKSTDGVVVEQLLKSVLSFLSKCIERDLECGEAWNLLIERIFEILTSKGSKNFSQALIKFCVKLLRTNKLNSYFAEHMPLLISYLRKGKDIDKVFFSFEKLLLASDHVALGVVNDLVHILGETNNSFYIKYCSVLLGKLLQKWRQTDEASFEFLRCLLKKKASHLRTKFEAYDEAHKAKMNSFLRLIKEVEK